MKFIYKISLKCFWILGLGSCSLKFDVAKEPPLVEGKMEVVLKSDGKIASVNILSISNPYYRKKAENILRNQVMRWKFQPGERLKIVRPFVIENINDVKV